MATRFARACAAVAAMTVMVAIIPPAGATHRPEEYCSESGDVCTSTRRVEGVRKFRLTMAERYFERYRLCVKGPDGSRSCERFRVERQGQLWGDEVRWRRHFPDEGPGAYTVVWRHGGERLGDKLGFHVRN